MAPEVIDLLSSSPSPQHAVEPTATARSPRRRSDPRRSLSPGHGSFTKGSRHLTGNTRADTIDLVDVETLSDFFDSSSQPDEPISVATSVTKRRRISPPRASSTSGALAPSNRYNSNTGPAVVKASGVQPSKKAIEQIDFSSSLGEQPHQSPRRVANDTSLQRSSPLKAVHTRQKPPSSDFDPFASSPPPVVAKQPPDTVRRPQPDLSSDPFASSPPPAQPQRNLGTIKSPADSRGPARSTNTHTNSTNRNRATQRRELEPISSSAPESYRAHSPPHSRQPPISRGGAEEVINIGDSSSEGSDGDLPDVADFDLSQPARRRHSPLRRARSDVLPSRKPSASKSKGPVRSAEERQRDRDVRTREKEEEKERKRRQREQDKATKAREKDKAAALAEVNKVRTDKKVSTPEMIVDLPTTLNPTVDVQAKTLLEGLGVQHRSWESPIPNAIKWRRKVTSRFNDDVGYWEPCLPQIEAEHHVLVYMNADEFVRLSLDERLQNHVEDVKTHFPNHSILYLIEGLTPWLRKNRNIRNRQFTSDVRAQNGASSAAAPTTTARRRNVAPAQEYVCEDTIEDALLQLQVEHDVLIHHTTVPLETAQWIATFTQHISTIPYRKRRDENTLGAGFCMESGQVRTGDDANDTYVRMLQEIVRVTAPIAYGVASEFDTVSKLVRGLETGGPTRLEGVRKSANKDGAFSDRNIGQAVSRRLHKVFTGRDETSTDV